MKHPKRLTVEMKRIISAEGLDPDDWWYIENSTERLAILNKTNCDIKVIEK